METAFRTTNKQVLEAHEAYLTFHADLGEKRVAFAHRFGEPAVMTKRSGMGHGTHVVGLPGDPNSDVYPDGWRWSPSVEHLIPNLRKKLGKDIAVEMGKDLTDPGPDLPGMPPFHMQGFGIHSPAYFLWDGALYVGWGCPLEGFHSIDDRHGDKVDLTLWDSIKISTYYVAVEQYRESKEREQRAKESVKVLGV